MENYSAVALCALLVVAAGALIRWHPFLPLIAYPEQTVAWCVQEGDAAFLHRAVCSRFLPKRARRAALYGVIDLRRTFRLPGDAAAKLVHEFAGDVPAEVLIMLYPPFVAGRINPRLRAVLGDAHADRNTRFAAFCSLTERPQDRLAHADQISRLLETIRPEEMHAMLSRMWLKLQLRDAEKGGDPRAGRVSLR